MTSSDHDSDASKAPTTITTPFSIAARSGVSSHKPAKNTRHIHHRRPVIPSQPRKPRILKEPRPLDDLPASEQHTALATIPINVPESPDEASEEDGEERGTSSSSETESLYTPAPGSSISQKPSESGILKRPRARTSYIHDFVSVQGEFFICNRCKKAYNIRGGTGAIARHLKKSHSIDPTPSGVAEKRIREGVSIDAAVLRGVQINQKAEAERRKELMGIGLDKATLEYLYLQWTIPQNIPFNHVRDQGFRIFLEYINPVANRMLPNSDSTIKSHAAGIFAEGKQRLRHLLATAISDIHITCDMWTSPNRLGLLGVVGHFTEEDSKLHTVTLALKELEGEHSGQNQAVIIQEVLDDFGIRNKLGYLVIDNATTNDRLIDAIAQSLHSEGVQYNAQQRRLRCNGHVINLAVQAFLFGRTVDDYEYPETVNDSPSDAQLNQWRRLGPLGKLHNINVWITGSPQRIQLFKKQSMGLLPHRDNSTRWNSWYNMLNWAIEKLKGAIIAVANEEPDLSQDLLSAEEWRILGHIRDFLQAFYDTTKATEGHAATLERVLPSMDFLVSHFEKAIVEFEQHDFMRESLHAGLTKMLSYWNKTERAPVYIAAIVLDPKRKWNYFKRWNPEWQPNMEATLQSFWETTYRSSTGLASYSSKPSASTRSTNNQFLQWLDAHEIEAESVIEDELDLYLSDRFIFRKEEERTVLEWWLDVEQRTRYPLLSRMAIDIYSVPAMSAEPERVFSGAKRTVSDSRGSLRSETIELLECLKSWFQLGIFTKEDLHAIVGIMEEGSMEGLNEALD